MSRHQTRQNLAREFGATDIVPERGDEAVARIQEFTGGIGADRAMDERRAIKALLRPQAA